MVEDNITYISSFDRGNDSRLGSRRESSNIKQEPYRNNIAQAKYRPSLPLEDFGKRINVPLINPVLPPGLQPVETGV